MQLKKQEEFVYMAFDHQEKLSEILENIACSPSSHLLEKWEKQKMHMQQNHRRRDSSEIVINLLSGTTELHLSAYKPLAELPDQTELSDLSLYELISLTYTADLQVLMEALAETCRCWNKLAIEDKQKLKTFIRIRVKSKSTRLNVLLLQVQALHLDENHTPWLIHIENTLLPEKDTRIVKAGYWMNYRLKKKSNRYEACQPIRVSSKRMQYLMYYADGITGMQLEEETGINENYQREIRRNLLMSMDCHGMMAALVMAKKMDLLRAVDTK